MKSIYSKLIQGFIIALSFSFFISIMISNHRNNMLISKSAIEELYKVNHFFGETIDEHGFSQSDLILEDFSSFSNVEVLISFKEGGTISYGSILPSIDVLPSSLYEKYETLGNNEGNYDNIYYYLCKYKIGTQEIYINTYRVIDTERSIFIESSFLLLICIFIYGSLIFLVIIEILIKPIQLLANAQINVGKGDFSIQVAETSHDEIGKLSKGFNEMVNKLAEHEISRQRFISDVSHEFRTPLTIIQGFAKIIKDESLSAEDYRKYGNIILHSSDRLSVLAQDMQLLTAIESNYYKIAPLKYSLSDQLEIVVQSFENKALEKNLKIKLFYDKRGLKIIGDKYRLEQVWFNLLSNAIKYSSEGIIEIHAVRDKKTITVTFIDNGIGMSQDELLHIYDRFYRVDESRSIEGSGLGMSIVKSILDVHKGFIDIKSVKGKGTTISVQFNLDDASKIE